MENICSVNQLMWLTDQCVCFTHVCEWFAIETFYDETTEVAVN